MCVVGVSGPERTGGAGSCRRNSNGAESQHDIFVLPFYCSHNCETLPWPARPEAQMKSERERYIGHHCRGLSSRSGRAAQPGRREVQDAFQHENKGRRQRL